MKKYFLVLIGFISLLALSSCIGGITFDKITYYLGSNSITLSKNTETYRWSDSFNNHGSLTKTGKKNGKAFVYELTKNNIKDYKITAEITDNSFVIKYNDTSVEFSVDGATKTLPTTNLYVIINDTCMGFAPGLSASSLDINDVSAITSSAFQCDEKLESVILGEKVTTVSKLAFAQTTRLKTITIKGATEIPEAFAHGSSVESVYINKKITRIGESAFKDTKNLSLFFAMYDKATICKYAFSGSALSSFFISSDITTVEDYAFGNFNGQIYASGNNYRQHAFDDVDKLNIHLDTKSYGTEADFDYVIHNNNEIEVYKYNGKDEIVSIPNTIKGLPVTSVASRTFSKNDFIKEINFDDNVKKIDTYAIYYCDNVEKIYIGANVLEIEGTVALTTKDDVLVFVSAKENEIPEKWSSTWNTYISADNIMYDVSYCSSNELYDYYLNNNDEIYVYNYKGDEEEVIIPATINNIPVTGVRKKTFSKNQNIKSISFGNNVKTIDYYVIYFCDNIETIYIGSSVTTINGQIALTNSNPSVYVSHKANEIPAYWSTNWLDGFATDNIRYDVLMFGNMDKYYYIVNNNYKAELCSYTGNDEIVIVPNNVAGYPLATIAKKAFHNNIIKEILFGDNVETIDRSAIFLCDSLEKVYIGANVKKILGNIVYNGTNIIAYVSCEEESIPDTWSSNWKDCFSTIYYNVKSYDNNLTYDYIIHNNNEVKVYGYTGEEENVVIPAIIDGCPVTEVARKTFFKNSTIKTISFTNNVETIDRSAVYLCESLEKVYIGASVKKILGNIVYNGTSIIAYVSCEEGSIPDKWSSNWKDCFSTIYYNVKSYDNNLTYDYIIHNNNEVEVYGYTGEEENVVIPAIIEGCPVTEVAKKTFFKNSTIKTISFTNYVKTIDRNAIYDCSRVEAIYIGQNVKNIKGSIINTFKADIKVYVAYDKISIPSTWSSDWKSNIKANNIIYSWIA